MLPNWSRKCVLLSTSLALPGLLPSTTPPPPPSTATPLPHTHLTPDHPPALPSVVDPIMCWQRTGSQRPAQLVGPKPGQSSLPLLRESSRWPGSSCAHVWNLSPGATVPAG